MGVVGKWTALGKRTLQRQAIAFTIDTLCRHRFTMSPLATISLPRIASGRVCPSRITSAFLQANHRLRVSIRIARLPNGDTCDRCGPAQGVSSTILTAADCVGRFSLTPHKTSRRKRPRSGTDSCLAERHRVRPYDKPQSIPRSFYLKQCPSFGDVLKRGLGGRARGSSSATHAYGKVSRSPGPPLRCRGGLNEVAVLRMPRPQISNVATAEPETVGFRRDCVRQTSDE